MLSAIAIQASAAYQLSVGATLACALDDSGVHCWGDNYCGQLNLPVFSNPIRVSVGGGYICVIDDKGLRCFGNDPDSPPDPLFPRYRPPKLDNPVEVVAVWNSHPTYVL